MSEIARTARFEGADADVASAEVEELQKLGRKCRLTRLEFRDTQHAVAEWLRQYCRSTAKFHEPSELPPKCAVHSNRNTVADFERGLLHPITMMRLKPFFVAWLNHKEELRRNTRAGEMKWSGRHGWFHESRVVQGKNGGRLAIDARAKAYLEDLYRKSLRYPTVGQMQLAAMNTGLSYYSVRNWYMNRRKNKKLVTS